MKELAKVSRVLMRGIGLCNNVIGYVYSWEYVTPDQHLAIRPLVLFNIPLWPLYDLDLMSQCKITTWNKI